MEQITQKKTQYVKKAPGDRKPQDLSKRKVTIRTTPAKPSKNIPQADRLRFFRLQENLTLAAMSKLMGVSQASLVKYELGDYYTPIKVIVFLHVKFGMRYEWFYHGTGRRKATDDENKKTLITDITNMSEMQSALTEKVAMLEKHLFKAFEQITSLNAKLNQAIIDKQKAQ